MKIEIHRRNWQEVDINEAAQLLFTADQASPFWRPEQNLDWFRRFIQHRKERFSPSFVILARAKERLVGMTTVITADPAMYDLWRWHPVVLPGDHEDEIATALIKASIKQMRADDARRLEVCFDFGRDDLRPETEAYYQKYDQWYEQCGAVKLDEFVYMTCETAVSQPIAPNFLNDNVAIRAFIMLDKDTLYDCFYRAFHDGKDRSFLEKTEPERRAMFEDYFDDPENLNEAASLILSKNQRVVGFSIFKSRPHVGDEHLAALCIHPDYQSKGLGRQLLSISMAKIVGQGDKLMSLGVDLDNSAAYKLYKKLGFKTQTKLITHVWKP
ncbi:MAG: GNAT family N-acetyltransferase [Chloroflexi bacterium]|nr:GNAT family N-acetyltransferase [Chloroflexota bacterium]